MLTQKEVKKYLDYNPDTGIFKWKISIGVAKPNKIAGHKNTFNYIEIRIKGKSYKAHRLVWLYMYGEFPKKFIDHINRKKDDNRICNLRDADAKLNSNNRLLPKSKNKTITGIQGIYYDKRCRRYMVRICRSSFGQYADINEAKKVRNKLEKKYKELTNNGITNKSEFFKTLCL